MSEHETVGLGYKHDVNSNATFDELWKAFVTKAYHPDLFLPVTDVKTTDNPDGSIYREMTHNKEVVRETIYLDKAKGEIRFVVLNADGHATDLEHVNALYRGTPMQIEYFQRKVGGERVPWAVPRKMAAQAITKQIAMASEQR